MKIAIIDGDSLIYQSSKNSFEESLLSLNDRIQNIFEKNISDFINSKCEINEIILFLENYPFLYLSQEKHQEIINKLSGNTIPSLFINSPSLYVTSGALIHLPTLNKSLLPLVK